MEIEINAKSIFLIILLALGVLYISFAYGTAFLGEDEATYISFARELMKLKLPVFDRQGLPQAIPPLVPTLFVPFFLAGFSFLAFAKIIICIFGILTLVVIYLIGKKINLFAGIASPIILLAIPYFTHFMFLAYVEVPIAFFSVMVFYLFLFLDSIKKSFLTGVILGLSMYVKSSGIFLPIILLIYAIILFLLYKNKEYLKFAFIACVISGIIILPLIIRNILFYNYPFIEGLNLFFKLPKEAIPSWITPEITRAISPKVDYSAVFGTVPILFGIIGCVYFFETRDKILFLSVLMVVLFLIFYFVRFYFSGVEPRYFSIIFPQLALIGGIFLGKLQEKMSSISKYSFLIFAAIILFCLYSSFTIAYNTHNSQRYPSDYIQALTWIKDNTKEDSLIFTTYGGSVKMFAERDRIWNQLEEFPTIMTTQNSSYIYQTLKKYNVTHILIWRAVIAENYIIPESNLLGAFTYNFVSVVLNDTEHFKNVYSNQNNIVLELN